MNAEDFYIGQVVHVVPAYGTRQRVPVYDGTVTKVGRTRVHVQCFGQTIQFYLGRGAEVRDPAQVRVVTRDQLLDEIERDRVVGRLQPHSIAWGRLTTEQLRLIAAIVLGDEPTEGMGENE